MVTRTGFCPENIVGTVPKPQPTGPWNRAKHCATPSRLWTRVDSPYLLGMTSGSVSSWGERRSAGRTAVLLGVMRTAPWLRASSMSRDSSLTVGRRRAWRRLYRAAATHRVTSSSAPAVARRKVSTGVMGALVTGPTDMTEGHHEAELRDNSTGVLPGVGERWRGFHCRKWRTVWLEEDWDSPWISEVGK